ncbi:hypothetical protein [Lactobacillus ultunensis]|uniref:Uncharacterized protein n=1 Tax=Lactobacillus ultunensis DSM 16047 TaxID=525365 RepID=C2ENI4_9LACO|nr:hypothetical protein [Lactobacillus ultunensis]EEJ71988.1 hypothetical protein HMPREF0548_1230 [Lactobacillus ultunensis DSM 16047]KRL81986.1 hypothetical protein FC57_GL000224 [Lactobacillus ultunensis DSM 16047]QQP27613.1 hypothetical protein H4B44_05575 [Lactobacillus ultunensis]
MLVRRIIKTTFFCGLGLVIGKTISEQKHKNDIKKILSANYMDDHTKVELMQDLNGIEIDHKRQLKEINLNKVKDNLNVAKNKSLLVAKNVAKKLVK